VCKRVTGSDGGPRAVVFRAALDVVTGGRFPVAGALRPHEQNGSVGHGALGDKHTGGRARGSWGG